MRICYGPHKRRLVALAACLSGVAVVAFWLSIGSNDERPKPSILLFVYDTVRRDATSPYGEAAAVTPVLNRLAQGGLVYENAYVHAPWTLPSHVSLFSGLLPSQHGIGARTLRAPDQLLMLAEALAEAGYQTRAISENPWVGPEFNVTQGFDRVTMLRKGASLREFESAIDEALADRDPERGLLLFVNAMDAHGPYGALKQGRFVPKSTVPEDVPAALGTLQNAFCSRSDEVAKWRPLWWQMYLSGVRNADDKLGAALARLGEEQRPLVTVATSDHGQAFGEHHLTSHVYSVREQLIRIPLVVHGIEAPPARIDAVVGSMNVHRSILEWAGANAAGNAAPLPVVPGDAADEAVVSEYFDTARGEIAEQSLGLRMLDLMRSQCGEDDRVHGDMRAVIRYPEKLIAYTQYSDELFDLETDPGEQRDLAVERPERVRELAASFERLRDTAPVDAEEAANPSSETIERLRALGYGPPSGAGDESATGIP